MRQRRKHDRFVRRLELEFSSGGRTYRGLSSDFSCSGLFIRTSHAFEPGSVVNITLYLPDLTPANLTGVVRRAIKTPTISLKNGMGIEIASADENYIKFMSGFTADRGQFSSYKEGPSGNGQGTGSGPEVGTTPAESLIIICAGCGVKNKIPLSKMSLSPKCGKCGTVLDQNSGPCNKEQTGASGSMVIACPDCGVKNKILKAKISLSPKCGKCGALLNAGPDPAEEVGNGRSDGPRSLHGHQYSPGDSIAGRYQIQDIFGGEGKSAMGIVYKCYDLEHDMVLALKTLQGKFLGSKKTLDSFKKEALAWIHLGKHPYIVRAHWVREIDQHMFIACEFITPDEAGRNSLTTYFKSPFSLKRTLTWAIQFCHGMEYACSKGVTPHRDIKPDNIMITMDGDVKIADFGLVGLWDKTEQAEEIRDLMQKNQRGLTFLSTYNNRIVAGSPPWMAPEQFYGVAEVKSDIYSFGIVLYQLINRGELPFQPRKGDTWRTAHKEYPVPAIPKQGAAVAHVLDKCLQKRRDKRYEDFSGLRKDLEDVFKREITRKTGEKPPAAPHLEELKEADLINKGMSLANLGLIEEGIRNYREGLKLNPKNADAHYNLGNALAQKGLLGEAINAYKEAIRIDRDLTAAHFNLGIALFNNGQIDLAINAYKEAIRTDPEFEEAYVNLGVSLHKKGFTDEAINAYREAARINPFFAEAQYKLGITLFADRRLDEAIEAFREAVHIRPEYAEAHNNLGTALMRKGLTDEAINSYRGSVAAKAGYADAHYNLGMALIKKGLHGEALDNFEEFIKYCRKDDGRLNKAIESVGKLKKYLAGRKR